MSVAAKIHKRSELQTKLELLKTEKEKVEKEIKVLFNKIKRIEEELSC